MFGSTTESLVWLCLATAAVWATTACVLVASRVLYDRRQRLHCAVDHLLNQPFDHRIDPLGDVGRAAATLLARRPLREVMQLVWESNAWRPATKLFAESIAARVGDCYLLELARSRRRRDIWRTVTALRVLSLTRHDRCWNLLAAALADGQPEVKTAACTILGQLGGRRSAVVLVDALRNGRYSRSRIAATLDAFDTELGDLIAPLLEAPDASVRFWAATHLQRGAQPPAIGDRFVVLTTDADPLVRSAAALALGVTGGPAAVIALRARLGDDVPFVRAHATRALVQLSGSGELRALLPLLADSDWTVRDSAKQSLRRAGDTVAAALLPFLTHADAFARNGAAEVLQNVGLFKRHLQLELEGSADPDRLRTLQLMARAGGPAMVESVVDRLDAELRPRAHALLAPKGEPPRAKEVA